MQTITVRFKNPTSGSFVTGIIVDCRDGWFQIAPAHDYQTAEQMRIEGLTFDCLVRDINSDDIATMRKANETARALGFESHAARFKHAA